jgi:predicted AlkP superfamily phosphohydrolase/phosphomutase
LAFWQIVSQHGKRVGVINVPMTYPADAVNGLMISGVDTPGKHSPGWTFPAGLMDGAAPELGEYIIECGLPSYAKAGRLEDGLDVARRTIEQRTAYSLHLMERYPWDLFVTVYTTIDALQHYFWKHMLARPDADSGQTHFQDVIRQAYIQVDRAVGQLVEQAPPGTTTLLVSDHGAGPTLRGFRDLPGWLAEHSYLAHQGGAKRFTPQALARRLMRKGYRWLDAHFGRESKLFLSQRLPGIRRRAEANVKFGQVDWSRTRAYISNSRVELRVNLKGREPFGTVEPGAEYEALREALIADLIQWRDPRTGLKMVTDVRRREEVYSGAHLEEAADLLIRWNDHPDMHDFAPGQGGDNAALIGITGGHRPNGIFVAHGPEIGAARRLDRAHIWDVAPTILYLLDLPIPQDMDGRLLDAALVEGELQERVPQYSTPQDSDSQASPALFAKGDEELMRDRLRGLGYID